MKRTLLTLLSILFVGSAVTGVSAQDFDLVILNGRVMDPATGYDQVANVGIKNGKIEIVTEDTITGVKSIDASGHVVAPGFVDHHSHTVPLAFGQKLSLRNGVTTVLENEVGAFPVDLFYDRLEGKSQANYGATASLAGIREKVMNPDYNSATGSISVDVFLKDENMFLTTQMMTDVPTDSQVSEILELLDSELKRGALGVGNAVGYMSRGVTSAEMIGVQKMAGKYDLASYLHGRFSSQEPPATGVLSVQESLANLPVYGGGLYVHHIHQQTLNQTTEAIDLLNDAQAAGLKAIAEIYPYNFGATVVSADYLVPENYGPNMGRDYSDITETATMRPLTKARYEELMANDPAASVTFVGISEQGMLDALANPATVVGSDAFPLVISETGEMAIAWDTDYTAVQGHPRAAGSHAKVLRLVREEQLMPLMLAISKMSYMPARFLEENGVPQMSTKGRLQVGTDADIVVFDPETVTDNSTINAAGLPPSGIPFVVVNGTVVVEASRVLPDVFPGRPIRNPVIE